MGLFSSIDIANTGLSAQRLRLDVIANNIANASSTRTAEGGAFKRSRLILTPKVNNAYQKGTYFPKALDEGLGKGVKVVKIEEDRTTPLKLMYDPSHPDSIKVGPKAGYVEMPNVDVVTEMVDLISSSRSYEANSTIIKNSKDMFLKALDIIN